MDPLSLPKPQNGPKVTQHVTLETRELSGIFGRISASAVQLRSYPSKTRGPRAETCRLAPLRRIARPKACLPRLQRICTALPVESRIETCGEVFASASISFTGFNLTLRPLAS